MQKERLTTLEKVIDKNRRSFYEIGKALKEIRDDRLYRFLLFKTFEAYTRVRWEIGKSQAYRLIRKYIASSISDNSGTQADLTGIISDTYKEAALAMLEQIRQAQSDGWQSTSREASFFWNRVMKEKIMSDTSLKRRQNDTR